MFGSGAWLGLILALALMLVVAVIVKYSSIVWLLVLIFLTFEYMGEMGGEISITSNFMWSVIICFVGVAVMAFNLLRDCGVIGKK